MAGISMDRAALISIIVEALLFGIFVVMFFYSHSVSMQRRKLDKPVDRTLWIASGTMLAVGLAHLAVDAQRLVLAFLSLEQDPSLFLTDLSTPTHIAKYALFAVQTVLGDVCIVYRLFIIWSRSFTVIIAPVLLTAGFTAAAIGLMVEFVTASPGTNTSALNAWATAVVATSLATNLLCTLLISARIWRASSRRRDRRSHDDVSRAYATVIAAIIESGAVYSAALLALLGVYLSGSYGSYVILDSIPNVIGITFTMINLRLSQGYVLIPTTSTSSGRTPISHNQAFDVRLQHMRSGGSSSKDHDDRDRDYNYKPGDDGDGDGYDRYSMRPTSGGIANVTHLSTIDEVSTAGERSRGAFSSFGGVSTVLSTSTMRGEDEVFAGDPLSSDGHR